MWKATQRNADDFFKNIFDETESSVMYEVQNFLSATSIFVGKFLLNIFAAAGGLLCQKFVNFNHFKLLGPVPPSGRRT